ncbi:MAG TPA: hypothetical protein VFY18_06485 [Candidatus Limnocylindrales bacterium]|nr:hypothetical protein [Candidatus Limnocylindrales bacterium]
MPPSASLGPANEPTGGLARSVGRARRIDLDLRSASTPARRDLEIVAATVVGMAATLDGPLVWLAAILLLAAMVIGTLQVLAAAVDEHLTGTAGIPIESLILPAVAAIGCLGAIRLVPVGLAVAPALAATAFLIDRALAVETRLAALERGPTAEDRSMALVTTLVIALVAFIGVAAVVPGGIAGLEPAGAPVAPLPLGSLVLLGLADAFIAGLLGYRAAALRVTSVREALWSALTYGVAIAIGAAAIRAMGIPRLIGPALLMFLFYLWDVLHGTAPSRRRDPRWIWQTALLAGLGALVALWNLRLVG